MPGGPAQQPLQLGDAGLVLVTLLVALEEGMRFSRKVAFQVDSRLGLRACLRHTSAGDWAPVKTSRTTWALNSGVKRRRFFIRVRLPSDLQVHYAPVRSEGRTTEKN